MKSTNSKPKRSRVLKLSNGFEYTVEDFGEVEVPPLNRKPAEPAKWRIETKDRPGEVFATCLGPLGGMLEVTILRTNNLIMSESDVKKLILLLAAASQPKGTKCKK